MEHLKILATECGMGSCPTIIKDTESGNFIVIGKDNAEILKSATVRAKVGEGETAVVIPTELLISLQEQLLKSAA